MGLLVVCQVKVVQLLEWLLYDPILFLTLKGLEVKVFLTKYFLVALEEKAKREKDGEIKGEKKKKRKKAEYIS